ncbi:IS4 family transposase [Nostoc sp.]|uniref:IS4 family transposase n=1 Tax=Nostoc sp. TaxID=1180 RepID=UPI003FA5499D
MPPYITNFILTKHHPLWLKLSIGLLDGRGFLDRKGDGSPGVKVLWCGLTRLHDLVQGWEVCQSLNRLLSSHP